MFEPSLYSFAVYQEFLRCHFNVALLGKAVFKQINIFYLPRKKIKYGRFWPILILQGFGFFLLSCFLLFSVFFLSAWNQKCRKYHSWFCVATTLQSHSCILWWVSFLYFLLQLILDFESQFLCLEWEGSCYFLPSLLLQWIKLQVNLAMQISFNTWPNSPLSVQFAVLCLFSGHSTETLEWKL